MIDPHVTDEEVARSRALLDDVVKRCSADRWAEFPKDVREMIAAGRVKSIVLMGLDRYILDEHLRLVDCVLANNPGMQMRAVVSDSWEAITDPSQIESRGWKFLTTKEFFERSAEFADCLVVDRYCTWIPAIRYKAQLKRAGLPVLRFEQFMNMPGMNPAGAYYKAQSDFMLEHLDEILALDRGFADAKSAKVLYNSLAGFISMNFVYFGLSCDDHRERYFPSDVGFRFTDQEVLADIGALDGSEVLIFAEKMGRKFKGIHAFEPDKRNFRKLSRKVNAYIAEHGAMDIYCHNFGAYDRNDYLGFTGTDYAVTVGDDRAEDGQGLLMARIDDVMDEMTYLRLEAEGSEAAVLRGATGLIKRDKPKMCVSTYHRVEDFLVLPKMIRDFDRGYEMKLRHQSLEYGVLCLYCQ
jgi:FkbM family methyltransferase